MAGKYSPSTHHTQGEPVARFDGAVSCSLAFVLPRPKSTPKRKTPPAVKKPDVDKLTRAAFDAITSSGVIQDDSLIVSVHAMKRLAEIGETPGLRLMIAGYITEAELAA